MRAVWYYADDGRVVGPLTWSELAALAAAGRVRAGDPVWRDGEEPRAAEDVPGLPRSQTRGTASDEDASRGAARAWWKHPAILCGATLLVAVGATSSQLANRPASGPPAAPSPKELAQTSRLDRRLVPRPEPAPAGGAGGHFDRGVGHARRGGVPAGSGRLRRGHPRRPGVRRRLL
jgi:hypothetical protein